MKPTTPIKTLPSAGTIRVGTPSWSEPEFVKAEWYPKGLPAVQQLPFYAEHFDMVELNSSFYAIPQARMCDRWAKVTLDGFLFGMKCHRLLSRMPRRPTRCPPISATKTCLTALN